MNTSTAFDPARNLPAVTATQLVASMQRVTHEVMTHGAVVVTRHDQPTMVLMSIERFRSLEQAARPDLEALTQRFDEMFDRMQEPGAADAMAEAFAMSGDELGDAAQRAAAASAAATATNTQATGKAGAARARPAPAGPRTAKPVAPPAASTAPRSTSPKARPAARARRA